MIYSRYCRNMHLCMIDFIKIYHVGFSGRQGPKEMVVYVIVTIHISRQLLYEESLVNFYSFVLYSNLYQVALFHNKYVEFHDNAIMFYKIMKCLPTQVTAKFAKRDDIFTYRITASYIIISNHT